MKTDPLVETLKMELTRKKSRNQAYSLRTYARDLDIDPSNLSKIMTYQKELGFSLRVRLGKKLGFDSSEIISWLRPTDNFATNDQKYTEHDLRIFELVSEWQHYAILEVLKVKGFDPKPAAIAKAMGISLEQVKTSLSRMQELGLLEVRGDGLVPKDEASSSILSGATSRAHRSQQRQILEGAIDVLEKVPGELRSQTSMTMAIDTNKLDKAKELIKNFRRQMGQLLSSSSNLDEVYQLSISLYPVTQLKQNRKEK